MPVFTQASFPRDLRISLGEYAEKASFVAGMYDPVCYPCLFELLAVASDPNHYMDMRPQAVGILHQFALDQFKDGKEKAKIDVTDDFNFLSECIRRNWPKFRFHWDG